ncbi:MAG: sensor domain-containing diguanylate cyclase [Anaerolineales bacterium]|nr:sensor domain-containing diguanylate cyclase [Anaerolineales bacterium]
MDDIRSKILEDAYQVLETQGESPIAREYLLKLLDVLSTALEKYSQGNPEESKNLALQLIDHRAMLMMLKQQTDELDALKKLSINLTSSLELPDVLNAVVTEAMRLVFNARDVSIFLYNDQKLSFGAALDSEGKRNKPFTTPRNNGLTYTVARTGEMIIVENTRTHPLFKDITDNWAGSIIGIPLKVGKKIVGVMNLARVTAGKFSHAELRLLSLLADQAAVAISNASLHLMISQQAFSDTVTGLPNRRALDERLEDEASAARRNNYSFAVIMMDLDGFKEVNDTYGHGIGDDVLRYVFNFMARGVRNTDFLARYGGDELTLILTQSDLSSARIVAEKIVESMQKLKFKLPDGKNLSLGISGGIALYPTHGRTGSDLLRAADTALYQAKKYERGSFQIARGVTAPLSKVKLPE